MGTPSKKLWGKKYNQTENLFSKSVKITMKDNEIKVPFSVDVITGTIETKTKKN